MAIKFVNLVDLNIADYMDKEDFIASIVAGDDFGDIDAVFHEGACSSTTEWDGKYMMDNNYQYSKELLHYCLDRQIPFLYVLLLPPMVAVLIILLKKENMKPHLMCMATLNSCLMNMCAKFCLKHNLWCVVSVILMCMAP